MPVDRGKGNPLLDAAQQVGVETEQRDTEQRDTEPARAEAQPGSFEAFMGAFAARPGGLHR